MRHANKAMYFLSGVLTTLLLVSMITPALAAGLSKRIEVFTGASVYVDDVKLDPKDANGNPVDVFIYNGTTYLPIRAISNSLDIPIQWEGSTKSVYVGKHTGDKPAIWLTNMDYFSASGDFSTKDRDTDNLGNAHQHCIIRSFSRTYALNGIYSRMTGTLYQRYDQRAKSTYS